MVAAANIAAAREQYRIQRAELLPASRCERRRDRDRHRSDRRGESGADLEYRAGVGIPSFELDLFGRIRSLTKAELNRYLATEAAARATRLALVGDIANAWLTYAADASLLQIAEDTAASAEKSVRLTRARLEGGIAPRTDLRQAEQILDQARADLVAQQRTALAQDVNLLQLLVGAPIDPGLLPRIDRRRPRRRSPSCRRAELATCSFAAPTWCRPNINCARPMPRSAPRAPPCFPSISLTGLLGLGEQLAWRPVQRRRFDWSASAPMPTIRSSTPARAAPMCA